MEDGFLATIANLFTKFSSPPEAWARQSLQILLLPRLGPPDNFAVRPYLNENNIPQLFVASGDQEWDRPRAFPWTMGWQPPFRAEGQIFANYIEAYFPGCAIAVLWQNGQLFRCGKRKMFPLVSAAVARITPR